MLNITRPEVVQFEWTTKGTRVKATVPANVVFRSSETNVSNKNSAAQMILSAVRNNAESHPLVLYR